MPVILLQLISCGYSYDMPDDYFKAYRSLTAQKSDTLKVTHTVCTECSDLYILEGQLTINSRIDSTRKYIATRDIKVCGQFPLDFIDMKRWRYEAGLKFTVIGKVIMIDTVNAIGPTPVFFVERWSKIK